MIAGIVIVLLIVLYAFLVIRKKHRDIKTEAVAAAAADVPGKTAAGAGQRENNSFLLE